MSTQTALIERAAEVAATVGSAVLFGVRAHNGTVFCHCNDVESDGGTFEDALDGVVSRLADDARSEALRAKDTLERAGRVAALDGDV